MNGHDPAEHAWWLASRASGVVALLCITASVALGLAMAARLQAAPERRRLLISLHQQTALVGLVAIAVHGIALLGDPFLRPGVRGLVVPFAIDHEPLWTGLGVTGGWLAAILGLSYWIRDRIGPARWRALHRATILVYVLSVAHTLGSGTDGGETWMRLLVLVTGAPVLFLFVLRLLPAPAPARPAPAVRPAPAASAAPATAFRRLRVAEVVRETEAVSSFALEPLDGAPLAPFEAGQFLTVRVEVPGRGALTRSYSLSSAPDPRRYRIAVKREPHGAVSRHLHAALRPGDVLEASGPHGRFVLDERSRRPVVLASAGIGVTPVLAMLAALAARRDAREVWWIHGARSRAEHAFRSEAGALLARLPAARSIVRYSRPEPGVALDGEASGRVGAATLLEAGVPLDAEFHLCGPTAFVDGLRAGLVAAGAAAADVHSESFGPAAPTALPAAGAPAPAAPARPAGVEFARSGVSVTWDERFGSLLDLAEACAVAAPAACRVGECHACKTPVLAGVVEHAPEPSAAPEPGQALLCCARPGGDLRLDL